MFIEMKLEHITPAESAEVLEALATPQDPPITSVQKRNISTYLYCNFKIK